MLTGVEEIARLHVDQCDSKERIIDWSKTKNGKTTALHALVLVLGQSELQTGLGPRGKVILLPRQQVRPIDETSRRLNFPDRSGGALRWHHAARRALRWNKIPC
jgi:hypothetical protein